MKHTDIKIYDTIVTVLEYTQEDVDNTDVVIRLEVQNPEVGIEWKPLIENGEYIYKESRKPTSYYGLGHRENEMVSVIAIDLDPKQVANIFLSLNVETAAITDAPLAGAAWKPNEEDVVLDAFDAEEHEVDTYHFVSDKPGTIKDEDIKPEVLEAIKPKKTRRKK